MLKPVLRLNCIITNAIIYIQNSDAVFLHDVFQEGLDRGLKTLETRFFARPNFQSAAG